MTHQVQLGGCTRPGSGARRSLWALLPLAAHTRRAARLVERGDPLAQVGATPSRSR
jgi:hypothetical protein